MPTNVIPRTVRAVNNLLNAVPILGQAMFRDVNNNIPIIKSLNRIGNVVYDIPNTDAQICFRVLVYEIAGQTPEAYDALFTNPDTYRHWVVPNRVRLERISETDWNVERDAYGNRPRRLTGLRFIVSVPNRGRWGRWQSDTTRSVPVINGKLSGIAIQRTLNEVTSLINAHMEREDERTRIRRIQMEENQRQERQASTFMAGVLEQFPMESNDDYSWRDNYSKMRISIIVDKYQVGKVLDAIHRVRNMQTNPLDAEYLLKKDY